MELTIAQFKEEIEVLNKKDTKFNVESIDRGSVFFSFADCKVSVELDKDAKCGDITMFDPITHVETSIDFDIIDTITKDEDGEYNIEFNNGIADVVIKPVEQ